MFEYLLENYDVEIIFNTTALALGFLYGFLAQRKQFCFSGSIKDIILFNHTKRTASVLLAVITAIVSTQLLSYNFGLDLAGSRYFSGMNYIFVILGGIMFGFGMMLSDGCSSRHIVKAAQGEKDSLFILISLGIFSFITYTLLVTYNEEIFLSRIIKATMIEDLSSVPVYIPIVILLGLLYKTVGGIKDILQCWDGFLIGLLISLVWFSTTEAANELFFSISPQSLSFVYPLGKIAEYLKTGFDNSILNFSVWSVVGVIIGSFFSSRFNKEFSKKQLCDNSGLNPPKLPAKMIGGAFMGIGGILAVGCTVGQGLSGISTLSFASFIAALFIYISALVTAIYMKKRNALIACFIFDFKR